MIKERPLRTLLFVPGNKPRMLEKARTLPADGVFLDLEDSVPVGEKEAARRMVSEALSTGGFGPWTAVRVNDLKTGLMEADVQDVLVEGLDVICLPKAESAADIEQVASLIEAMERARGIAVGKVKLLPIVETALGLVRAYEIAGASTRVMAVCFGAEDFCADMGAIRSREGLEIVYARAKVVTAARAAGVPAIDTVYTDINNLEGLEEDAGFARRLGYRGKVTIHPRQIEIINRVFTPSAAEVAHARRVIEAFKAAEAQGEGATSVDGKMIDVAVVAHARQVLALAQAVGADPEAEQ
jgi:citrate lyase subunit beta/citryl-CoA lyase